MRHKKNTYISKGHESYMLLHKNNNPKNHWEVVATYKTLEEAHEKAKEFRYKKPKGLPKKGKLLALSGYVGVYPVPNSSKWKATINTKEKKGIYICTCETAVECAFYYNKYIIDNGLNKKLSKLPPDFLPPF
jgi:hypothetical protein